MDQALLSSRAVIGMYYARLANPAIGWVDMIANLFNSDQALETYAFLGQNPRMREWVGGRQAKGLRGNSFSITNKHYEATLEIALRDLRRDKTPQLRARINEFADEGQAHWGTLLSSLIAGGLTAVCYDGQFFFDADHAEGDSGNQSNKIQSDLSDTPAAVHGIVTNPSVEEMQQALMKGVAQIISFKDDQGRPMNNTARRFLALMPTPTLYMKALAAVSTIATAALAQNINPNVLANFRIDVDMDAESAWTDQFTVWRTDSEVKALIRQSETDPNLKVKDENSEFAFDNDAMQLGIDAWRNAGYGYWQRACHVTFVA